MKINRSYKTSSHSSKKKFDGGLPRVSNRQIPLHYLYDIQIPSITQYKHQNQSFQNYQSLSQTLPLEKSKENSKQKNLSKRSLFDILLIKYATRKAKRISQRNVSPFKSVQVCNFKNQHKADSNSIMKYRKKSKQILKKQEQAKSQNNNQLTKNYDIDSLYNKNLHEMTKQQLQETIKWKKQFLKLIENKKITLNSKETEIAQRSTTISFNSIRRW